MIDRVEHKRVTPPFTDEILECIDCGDKFTFSGGEKHYFCDKNFNYPRRCPRCREARKRGLHPLVESQNNHRGVLE